MASQQTTRQAWSTATGQDAFTPYDTIRQSAQVPEVFRKRSQWRDDSGRENGYYSYTENEPNHFIPVEFDSERFCWIEIRWITEPETSIVADHWQAFQIAREELGLDITIEERDQYITDAPSTPGSFRAPLNTSTPIIQSTITSHVNKFATKCHQLIPRSRQPTNARNHPTRRNLAYHQRSNESNSHHASPSRHYQSHHGTHDHGRRHSSKSSGRT